MIQFTTHRFLFFSRREIWFYDGENFEEGTYTAFSAAHRSLEMNTSSITECKTVLYGTILTDLLKSKEELFSLIHPTFRYDIKSAEKRNLHYEADCNPTINNCDQAISIFQKFAKSKNLNPINRKWLLALNKSNSICISKISMDNIVIVIHIYIVDKKESLLSHSFHNVDFKNDRIKGEANKSLHWKDIQFFKSMNFEKYDWGGTNFIQNPGISKFKLNFGGSPVTKFRYIKTSPLIYRITKLYKSIFSLRALHKD